MQFLEALLPNLITKLPELWECILETLFMVAVSGAVSFVFGMILGITLVVTRKGGILSFPVLYNVLDKAINIFRSIPFVILLAMLIPLTRLIVGSAIGTKGALIPLIFGTVPFFARQVETALAGTSHGLVEAALAMGDSPMQIIFRVYLKEGIPAIVRGTSITAISLIGLTAMAGAVGGGGLGDFAIRYGHQRNQTDVTYVTVIIILLMVSVVQMIGNYIIKKTTH